MAVVIVRICNKCNAPRHQSVMRCPTCWSPEFRIRKEADKTKRR